jgi:hypothetical protein
MRELKKPRLRARAKRLIKQNLTTSPSGELRSLIMTDRRRSSAGTKRPSVVDHYHFGSVDGLGWGGHDVIEEEGKVTSPRDTSVPPSSEPSPTIRPVTGARPRIRQVQVREAKLAVGRRLNTTTTAARGGGRIIFTPPSSVPPGQPQQPRPRIFARRRQSTRREPPREGRAPS